MSDKCWAIETLTLIPKYSDSSLNIRDVNYPLGEIFA